MPIHTYFHCYLHHAQCTRSAFICIVLLSVLLGCDDSTSTSADLTMNPDLAVDQMVADSMDSGPVDIGIDMLLLPEDMLPTDMAWSFDLAIVEEEYSAGAEHHVASREGQTNDIPADARAGCV